MRTGERAAARRMPGSWLGALVGGIVLAGLAAPAASAAPDCSPQGVSNTSDSVTAAARQYLNTHPDASDVLMTAALQPRPQAEATVRDFASSHPQETAEFKQILTPLGDTQRQCNVQVVPPQFQWAFSQFMG